MKFTEIKDMSNAELVKKQKAAAKEIFTAKMKNSLGQLSNPLEIRKMRRELARIKTAISQKSAQ